VQNERKQRIDEENKGDSSQDMILFDSNSFAWCKKECKQGKQFKRWVYIEGG